jgi:hypothetical protein
MESSLAGKERVPGADAVILGMYEGRRLAPGGRPNEQLPPPSILPQKQKKKKPLSHAVEKQGKHGT